MNDDKVIEILTMVRNRPSQIGSRDAEINMAIDTAIEALEKQVPKKAEWYDNDHTTCLCPNCNTEIDVWLGDFPDYCRDCGQKIDWHEVW